MHFKRYKCAERLSIILVWFEEICGFEGLYIGHNMLMFGMGVCM